MLEHEGKQYARVSDIIRPFSSYDHINVDILANKSRIGTEVHKAIADDLDGEFCVTTRETTGYFNSYRKWRDEIRPQFLQWETRYFCEEKMLTGQIDTVLRMPNELTPILLDFKTSAQESAVPWNMQAHLYRYLLLKNKIDIGPRFLFLRLHKEGLFPHVHLYRLDQNLNKKCMVAIDDFWKSKQK